MSDLIGPLTAEEWCSLRLTGEDDDILHCCANTSTVRDLLFGCLRMNCDRLMDDSVVEALGLLRDHGFPSDTSRAEGTIDPRVIKLAEWVGIDLFGDPAILDARVEDVRQEREAADRWWDEEVDPQIPLSAIWHALGRKADDMRTTIQHHGLSKVRVEVYQAVVKLAS